MRINSGRQEARRQARVSCNRARAPARHVIALTMGVIIALSGCGGGGGSSGEDGGGGGGNHADGSADSSAPEIVSGTEQEIAEGATETGYRVRAVTEDETELNYALSGGADRVHFRLDGRGLIHVAYEEGLEYEVPVDADGDNVYELEVTASSESAMSESKMIRIRVLDDPEFQDQMLETVKMQMPEPGSTYKPRTVRISWKPDAALAERANEYRILVDYSPMDAQEGEYSAMPVDKLGESGVSGDWHYQEIWRPMHLARWNSEEYRVEALAADGSVVATSGVVRLSAADSTAMVGYGQNPILDDSKERSGGYGYKYNGFGETVAVSGNGKVLAAATWAVDTGTGYCDVRVRIWRHTGTSWSLDTNEPILLREPDCYYFSFSSDNQPYRPVALSLDDAGQTLAIGWPQADLPTSLEPDCTDSSRDGAGRVMIFSHDYGSLEGEGDNVRDGWTLTERVYSAITAQFERFGTDVELSGDGTVLVVGAPRADGLPGDRCHTSDHEQTGNVYVYERGTDSEGRPDRDQWEVFGTLWPYDRFGDRITDREPRGKNAYRGRYVATNYHGDFIAVVQGSNRHTLLSDGTPPRPEVQIYTRPTPTAGNWTYKGFWQPDIHDHDDGNYPITDVALASARSGSYEGHWLALGTPEDDYGCGGVAKVGANCVTGNDEGDGNVVGVGPREGAGSVYLVELKNNGTILSSGAYRVKAEVPRIGERFGSSVDLAIGDDGNSLVLVAGAPGHGGTAAGVTTHVRDPNVSGYESRGAAHVYVGDNGLLGGLALRNRLKASNPVAEYGGDIGLEMPRFGHSVAMSADGETLLIGARGSDTVIDPYLPLPWGIDKDFDPSGAFANGGAVYLY